MATTARSCDLLVRNALILTLDADDRILANGTVAVSDDRIVSVGPTDDQRVRWLPSDPSAMEREPLTGVPGAPMLEGGRGTEACIA